MASQAPLAAVAMEKEVRVVTSRVSSQVEAEAWKVTDAEAGLV